MMKIAVRPSIDNPASIGQSACLGRRAHAARKLVRKYRISIPMALVVAEMVYKMEAR